MSLDSHESEAIVIIKAAPHVGGKHGETVCCAGIDVQRNWLRLYPIPFRKLDRDKKFGRWSRIKFQWKRPKGDQRIESRYVYEESLEVIGKLREADREKFLEPRIVTSRQGKKVGVSLFSDPAISNSQQKRRVRMKSVGSAGGLNSSERSSICSNVIPLFLITHVPIASNTNTICFKYKYHMDDGSREGRCQDWETEAAYYRWAKRYGEDGALSKMMEVFGEQYPVKGMLLAMGTHSRYPDTWLINGIVRSDYVKQRTLF